MNKYYATLLLFLAFEQTQCSGSNPTTKVLSPRTKNGLIELFILLKPNLTPMEKALLEDNGEALTAAIEQDPFAPLCKWLVRTAIRLENFSTINALVKIVNTNPKKLAQYGLEDDLKALLASQENQPLTVLMCAMHSSTEIAKTLLSIPAIAETINFSYDYNCLGKDHHAACTEAASRGITCHSALSSALLTNSNMVEILLRHNPKVLAPQNYNILQLELLIIGEHNIAEQNRVYRFHAYLKSKRPEQTLSPNVLKMISSYLRTSSWYGKCNSRYSNRHGWH